MTNPIVSVGLNDRHLAAIGKVSVLWAGLETIADHLLGYLIPLQSLKDIHCFSSEVQFRDRLKLIKAFSHTRLDDPALRDEIAGLVNNIDNNLRNRRNRVVHDHWALGTSETPTRLRFQVKYKKTATFQPDVMSTTFEESMSAADIEQLCLDIFNASHDISILIGKVMGVSKSK